MDHALRVQPGGLARSRSLAVAACAGIGRDSADAIASELVAFGQGIRPVCNSRQLTGQFGRRAVELRHVRYRSVRELALPGRSEFAVHACEELVCCGTQCLRGSGELFSCRAKVTGGQALGTRLHLVQRHPGSVLAGHPAELVGSRALRVEGADRAESGDRHRRTIDRRRRAGRVLERSGCFFILYRQVSACDLKECRHGQCLIIEVLQ